MYFQTENGTHYFFEVKCHELFDDHPLTSLSDQYKEKYFRDFTANNLIDASQSLFQHWNNENGNYGLCAQDFGVKAEVILWVVMTEIQGWLSTEIRTNSSFPHLSNMVDLFHVVADKEILS